MQPGGCLVYGVRCCGASVGEDGGADVTAAGHGPGTDDLTVPPDGGPDVARPVEDPLLSQRVQIALQDRVVDKACQRATDARGTARRPRRGHKRE